MRDGDRELRGHVRYDYCGGDPIISGVDWLLCPHRQRLKKCVSN